MIFCPFPCKPRSPTWINWVHPWRDSVNLLVLTLLGTILIPSLAMGVLLSGQKSFPWDPRSPTLLSGPTTLHSRPWGCCCQDTSGLTSSLGHQEQLTGCRKNHQGSTHHHHQGNIAHVLNVKRVRFSTLYFRTKFKTETTNSKYNILITKLCTTMLPLLLSGVRWWC